MGQSRSYRPWQVWSDSLLQHPSCPAARINKHLRALHRVPLMLACSGQHSVWWKAAPSPRTCLNLRMSATMPCRMVPNWRPTTPSTWPAARQRYAGTTNDTVSVDSWRPARPAQHLARLPLSSQPLVCALTHSQQAANQHKKAPPASYGQRPPAAAGAARGAPPRLAAPRSSSSSSSDAVENSSSSSSAQQWKHGSSQLEQRRGAAGHVAETNLHRVYSPAEPCMAPSSQYVLEQHTAAASACLTGDGPALLYSRCLVGCPRQEHHEHPTPKTTSNQSINQSISPT